MVKTDLISPRSEEVVKVMTRNLNKVIDINFYPVPETKRSNSLHRPIGRGVQGLGDIFAKLGYPFVSEEARKLNNDIFETIYYASMSGSMGWHVNAKKL